MGAAIRQYSLFDNVFSFIAFFMMAVPNFLFALVLMYLSFELIDFVPGGLFSADMIDQPWSLAKFLDLLKAPLDAAGDPGLRVDRRRRAHDPRQLA